MTTLERILLERILRAMIADQRSQGWIISNDSADKTVSSLAAKISDAMQSEQREQQKAWSK